jgi:predicted MFS family arabinose efflux permease
MPRLLIRVATLRLAAVRGALWFFAFCVVWSGLAVALAQPPYSYTAAQIGLFAFAGLSGIAATRVAGGWTDRVGAHRVVLVGLIVALGAAALLAFSLRHTAVAVIGLALFDAGLFAAQVANQSTVLAIEPSAPARFNSAYMVVYFVGGSAGTAVGAVAVEHLGWPATALVAAAAVLAAVAITAVAATRTADRP